MVTLTFLIIFAVLAIACFVISSKCKKKKTNTSNNSYDTPNYSALALSFKIAGWVLIVVWVAILLFNIFVIVDSGHVKVQKLWGRFIPGYVPEGFHAVNPFASLEETNIQRNAMSVQDADKSPGMTSTTNDNIQATVQANFSYMVNPEFAWWLRTYVGDEQKVRDELIDKAAKSATRDALASFNLQEAQIKKRDQFEKSLQISFADNIYINLPKGKGLSDEQLKNVIIAYPVQLMDVTPDGKVANALSEKKATEIDLERQKTLTLIADEVINRRGKEGEGIKKMFESLPKGYTANDVALVLDASANKTRSEAIMKAVETGKVSSVIFEGSAARTINK